MLLIALVIGTEGIFSEHTVGVRLQQDIVCVADFAFIALAVLDGIIDHIGIHQCLSNSAGGTKSFAESGKQLFLFGGKCMGCHSLHILHQEFIGLQAFITDDFIQLLFTKRQHFRSEESGFAFRCDNLRIGSCIHGLGVGSAGILAVAQEGIGKDVFEFTAEHAAGIQEFTDGLRIVQFTLPGSDLFDFRIHGGKRFLPFRIVIKQCGKVPLVLLLDFISLSDFFTHFHFPPDCING